MRGELARGARLPTQRALAEAVGVGIGTVTRAYAEAEARGLIDAVVGRGSFVARSRPPAQGDGLIDLSRNVAPMAPAAARAAQRGGGAAQTERPRRTARLRARRRPARRPPRRRRMAAPRRQLRARRRAASDRHRRGAAGDRRRARRALPAGRCGDRGGRDLQRRQARSPRRWACAWFPPRWTAKA